MNSNPVLKKQVAVVSEYRASEAKTVHVLFKGKIENMLLHILGRLRSICIYVGASRLKEPTKRTTFIRVGEQENQVYTKE